MLSVVAFRGTTMLLATVLGGWLAARLAAPAAFALLEGPRTFEQAVTGTCGLLLLACTAWAVLVLCAGVLGGLLRLLPPQAGVAAAAGVLDGCTPAVVRGVVATTLGVSMAAGVAGPSLAGSTTHGPGPGIDGLALPDRAEGAAPAGTTTGSAPTEPPLVVVRSGDSLWSIARRRLPAAASDAETATAVRYLYAVNRFRIGTDPDLILPGTRLVLPDLDIHHRKDRP